MAEDAALSLLTQIRDLQQQQLAVAREALANQTQALERQLAAIKRQEDQRRALAKWRRGTRIAVWVAIGLGALYIVMPLVFFLIVRNH
jgi:type VI protein secretion system component VasF